MYKDILLAVDLGDESSWKKALPTAVEHCRAFGSRLHLITVVPVFQMQVISQYFPEDFPERAVEEASQELHRFAAEYVPDDVSVQHIVSYGVIYEEIIAMGRKVKADLIVMASHRPELRDYLLGPNAARVVRHADTSVLVVRN